MRKRASPNLTLVMRDQVAGGGAGMTPPISSRIVSRPDSLALAQISLAAAAPGAVAVIAALGSVASDAPLAVQILVALATNPFAHNLPVALGATALVAVFAILEATTTSLNSDLGSHVLPPEAYQHSGEGATAECGKRLAS